jgi:hypothetical protein
MTQKYSLQRLYLAVRPWLRRLTSVSVPLLLLSAQCLAAAPSLPTRSRASCPTALLPRNAAAAFLPTHHAGSHLREVLGTCALRELPQPALLRAPVSIPARRGRTHGADRVMARAADWSREGRKEGGRLWLPGPRCAGCRSGAAAAGGGRGGRCFALRHMHAAAAEGDGYERGDTARDSGQLWENFLDGSQSPENLRESLHAIQRIANDQSLSEVQRLQMIRRTMPPPVFPFETGRVCVCVAGEGGGGGGGLVFCFFFFFYLF